MDKQNILVKDSYCIFFWLLSKAVMLIVIMLYPILAWFFDKSDILIGIKDAFFFNPYKDWDDPSDKRVWK